MTAALNFTPKAIADLSRIADGMPPLSAAGLRYIVGKLREAQVFVLPDCGELLDRSKPRPEVPGLMFRPPFPVTAVEYPALKPNRMDPYYTAAPCPKRIALAWDYQGDLPAELRRCMQQPVLGDGVIMASIAYFATSGFWMAIPGMGHLSYDAEWMSATDLGPSPFRDAAISAGRITKAVATGRTVVPSLVPLLPEAIFESARTRGGIPAIMDSIHADMADEMNAYLDLCCALACKNVDTAEHGAPEKLNKHRIAAGHLPLKGFHVLTLGDDGFTGAGAAARNGGVRSHLRRGHIRRLSAERITWVNQTMVRGSRNGFVDKIYAMKGEAA